MFVKRDKMISDWDNYQPGDVLDITRKSPADFIDEIKMDYIRPYLPDKGTILEVGCGSGRLLTRIGLEHPKSYNVIGVDNSPFAVDITRANIKQHNLSGTVGLWDARALGLEDDQVDVVCSGGVLEHFRFIEVSTVLKEMYRVLKPGGILYADIVPKKRTLCRPVIREDVGGFESNFDMCFWTAELEMLKFKDIKYSVV